MSSFPIAPRPPLDPTLAAASQRQRDALLAALDRTPPRGRQADRTVAAAVLDVLWSVVSYERMVVDWELAPDDAIRGLTWAIGLVEAAVRNGASPHATMHAQPDDEGDR